jgi:hypothetical protein
MKEEKNKVVEKTWWQKISDYCFVIGLAFYLILLSNGTPIASFFNFEASYEERIGGLVLLVFFGISSLITLIDIIRKRDWTTLGLSFGFSAIIIFFTILFGWIGGLASALVVISLIVIVKTKKERDRKVGHKTIIKPTRREK